MNHYYYQLRFHLLFYFTTLLQLGINVSGKYVNYSRRQVLGYFIFLFLTSTSQENSTIDFDFWERNSVVSLLVSTSEVHSYYFTDASFIKSHQLFFLEKAVSIMYFLDLSHCDKAHWANQWFFFAENRLQIRWRWLGLYLASEVQGKRGRLYEPGRTMTVGMYTAEEYKVVCFCFFFKKKREIERDEMVCCGVAWCGVVKVSCMMELKVKGDFDQKQSSL